MMYKNYIKTSFDKLFAIFILIVSLPLFIIIGITMLILGERPVFFTQTRTGKNKRHFTLYKFRTLKPANSNDLDMSNRAYTSIGPVLRKTGLDELPQLINILKGDMSFVGPRPLPVEYDTKYNQAQLRRFEAVPGITGWAQTHGRNETAWTERFSQDLWYVDHISLAVDLKVILITIVFLLNTLFDHRKTHVEMPVFEGSNTK